MYASHRAEVMVSPLYNMRAGSRKVYPCHLANRLPNKTRSYQMMTYVMVMMRMINRLLE